MSIVIFFVCIPSIFIVINVNKELIHLLIHVYSKLYQSNVNVLKKI